MNNKKENEELVEIYQDTIAKSKRIETNIHSEKHYYKKHDQLTDTQKPSVSVLPLDSVSTLELLSTTSDKICLLNMASYKRPGGGVKKGARAQEECLYRCSNLGIVNDEHYYPLEDNSAIYTSNAFFIKNFKYQDIKPIICDVITIAAYNQQKDKLVYYNDVTMEQGFYDKIKFIFQLAGMHRIDTLLLGAFGCGVFGNDPNVIAQIFKKVIDDGYTYGINKIIFPIINDHNSVGNNYQIFNSILNEK